MLVAARNDMRHVKTALLVAAVLLLGYLVYRVGTESILEALDRLAWWQLVLVCLPYGLVMAVDTLGWRFAFATDRAPFLRLLSARLAGEALNVLTAVGSVGGEAAKTWLVRRDVSYDESVPSVIIAKTTITTAQALFLLIGIVTAWTALDVDSAVLGGMLWMLVVEILAVGGFFASQLTGLVARGGRLLRTFGVVGDAAYAETLDRALRGYYRQQWRRLTLSVGFHLAGWIVGGVEAFVMLWALGIDAGFVTAMVIEALGSGVRFATFFVPANLGALEGANAAAFGALGLGAGAGLAFSFVRRARQTVWIGIGIVVLFAMRWDAARQATTARGARAA
jgi:uncharacterized protein (TIRG00374 family)